MDSFSCYLIEFSRDLASAIDSPGHGEHSRPRTIRDKGSSWVVRKFEWTDLVGPILPQGAMGLKMVFMYSASSESNLPICAWKEFGLRDIHTARNRTDSHPSKSYIRQIMIRVTSADLRLMSQKN